MLLKRTSVAILIAVAASGCTQMRRDRYCKYALPAWGAALGGAGAGLGVSQGSDHASAPEIGGAAAGGILAGGLLGALVGHYFCEEAPVEPPPPPPAPPPPPPPARRRIETLRGPQFDFDKSHLSADGKQHVQHAVQVLADAPTAVIIVEGYTDSIGSDAYNLRLSERRAQAVRDYLIELGIKPSRITTKGYGKARPVASNETKEGRAENRRVEILAE